MNRKPFPQFRITMQDNVGTLETFIAESEKILDIVDDSKSVQDAAILKFKYMIESYINSGINFNSKVQGINNESILHKIISDPNYDNTFGKFLFEYKDTIVLTFVETTKFWPLIGDSNGVTAFHLACQYQLENSIHWYMKNVGRDISILRDSNGRNPYHYYMIGYELTKDTKKIIDLVKNVHQNVDGNANPNDNDDNYKKYKLVSEYDAYVENNKEHLNGKFAGYKSAKRGNISDDITSISFNLPFYYNKLGKDDIVYSHNVMNPFQNLFIKKTHNILL